MLAAEPSRRSTALNIACSSSMWSASTIEQGLAVESERDGIAGDVRAPAGGVGAAQRLVHPYGVSCAGSHRRTSGERLERQLAGDQQVDGRGVALVEECFARGRANLASRSSASALTSAADARAKTGTSSISRIFSTGCRLSVPRATSA